MALKTHDISIPFVDGTAENQDSVKIQQVDADPSSLHHWFVQSDAYGCVQDDCNSVKLDMLEWLSEKIQFPEEVSCYVIAFFLVCVTIMGLSIWHWFTPIKTILTYVYGLGKQNLKKFQPEVVGQGLEDASSIFIGLMNNGDFVLVTGE